MKFKKGAVKADGGVETSSGFNSLGKPIRYRSASQAGVAFADLAKIDFTRTAYFNDGIYAGLANVDKLPSGNTTPLTYSIWIYPTNQWSGSQHVLFACGTDYSSNAYKIQFCGFNKINIGFNSWEFPCELNNWYHIVVTRDENKNWNVYYNGILLASQNWNVNIPSGGEAYIGGWYYSSFGNSYYHFFGNLANFQVFNRALSAEEVTLLYNQKAVKDGLVLHIPLQSGKDKDNMFTSKNFTYGGV